METSKTKKCIRDGGGRSSRDGGAVGPRPAAEGGAAGDGRPTGPRAAAEVRRPAAKARSLAVELEQMRRVEQKGWRS
jgi:hypothetical protein